MRQCCQLREEIIRQERKVFEDILEEKSKAGSYRFPKLDDFANEVRKAKRDTGVPTEGHFKEWLRALVSAL
jgi:hypothetical protein